MNIIRTVRQRVEKVRLLLSQLGDTDETLNLAAHFRRTGQRLGVIGADEQTADLYSQLTLAVHELNFLLSDAFYPGPAERRDCQSPTIKVILSHGVREW